MSLFDDAQLTDEDIREAAVARMGEHDYRLIADAAARKALMAVAQAMTKVAEQIALNPDFPVAKNAFGTLTAWANYLEKETKHGDDVPLR